MSAAKCAVALGNIWEQVLGPRTVAISYDAAANRVSAANDNGAVKSYAYDTRGNATGVGAFTFTYDFANQPTEVTGGASATYAYDGNLKRVKEVRDGKTIYTIYSKLTRGLIYRDEVTDATTTDYVTAGGAALRLRRVSGGAFDPEYSHFDAQGSVVAATNPAGTVRFREQYNPFGEERLDSAANDNDTAYTGHLMDDATGLVYMQARYYDPLIGRFLSTDPIGYQDQLNLYAYVHNDPVNMTDPTGEFANILIGGALGAVVGGAIEAVTNKDATRGSILRAAAVGAAAGALGPAGGTAARAALVGKAAASASKVSKAIPSGKALVAVTDTAADVVGQPVLGAVDAALQGQDPGLGAVEGVGAAGGAALAEAATTGGGSTTRGAAGARGAAAALGKTVAKQIVKAGAAAAGSKSGEQMEQPRVEEDLEK